MAGGLGISGGFWTGKINIEKILSCYRHVNKVKIIRNRR